MNHEFAISAAESRDAAMLAWIHNLAPYGVVTTDREFRIQSWNRWMDVHSGHTLDLVTGRNLFDVFPDLVDRGLVPRYQRALAGEVSVLSAALHGYLLPLEPPVRGSGFAHMQQTALVAPLSCRNEFIGTISVIEDVTHREQQALLLRRQRDHETILAWALAHLLEAEEPRRTTRDLFCKLAEHFDWDAYLLYLREADTGRLKLQAVGGVDPEMAKPLASLAPDETLGRHLLRLRNPQALEHVESRSEEKAFFSQTFGWRTGALLPLRAGEEHLGILCFGARTRDSLQPGELELLSTIGRYLVVALGREATARKLQLAQARLSEHAQDLELQVDERTTRLRETVAELETFSYAVAHDLRAPLRALVGYCQVLSEDFGSVLPEHARDIIGRLHRACQRMNVLTQDLLAFARVSRQQIELGPVNVETVMDQVGALVNTSSDLIVVKRPLAVVIAHPVLLQQCLVNLVDNAVKFVREGAQPQVRVWTEQFSSDTVVAAPVALSPFSRADLEHGHGSSGPGIGPPDAKGAALRVRINVQDNGIGVAPEAQAKIFGIFERGVGAAAYRGSGIGLAIVARAMARMGGTCGVESHLGSGSRFWLELPAAGTP